jgi:hypothetical protein
VNAGGLRLEHESVVGAFAAALRADRDGPATSSAAWSRRRWHAPAGGRIPTRTTSSRCCAPPPAAGRLGLSRTRERIAAYEVPRAIGLAGKILRRALRAPD